MANVQLIHIGVLTVIGLLLAGSTDHSQSTVQNRLRYNIQTGGAISEGWLLSIEAEKRMSSSREPILLTLVLKNVSPEERIVVGASPYKIYKLIVKDDKGKDASLTEFGKALAKHDGDFLERGILKIGPGQERREQVEVSKIFEMAAQGTYSVMAKRTVFKLNREGVSELVSNTIEVKVSR